MAETAEERKARELKERQDKAIGDAAVSGNPGTKPGPKAPDEIKGREAPIPTDAPREVGPAAQSDSVTNKAFGQGTDVFKAPQGERIQDPNAPCIGIAMHVGAPKHCPCCKDYLGPRSTLRAEPGDHGRVAK